MSDFFHFKFVYLLQLLHLVYPFGLWKIRWGDDKTASNELSKLTSLAELTMFMMKTQHRRKYFILSLYFSNDECVKQCRFRVIFESVLASIEWNSTRSKRSMGNSNLKGYGWKDWGKTRADSQAPLFTTDLRRLRFSFLVANFQRASSSLAWKYPIDEIKRTRRFHLGEW